MGISILVQFDELRELIVGGANLSLDGTYRELRLFSAQATPGSGKLLHNGRLLKLQNVTTSDVFISFDGGITTNDVIPAGGFALYDLTTNKSDAGGEFLLGEGGYIFARTVSGGVAAGTAVYASIIYGKGE
jgi:hypothetical protein